MISYIFMKPMSPTFLYTTPDGKRTGDNDMFILIGPTLWSFKFASVRLSVCPFVRLSVSRVLILPTIGFLSFFAGS